MIRCVIRVLSLLLIFLCIASAMAGAQTRRERLNASLPLVAELPATSATREVIARAAAPFLWPSSAEVSAPRALPRRVNGSKTFDSETDLSYYYSVRELTFRTEEDAQTASAGGDSTPLPAGLTRIDIRYFFYFPEEAGDTAHLNDLESAELWLLV
jgi:hypothetical protein